MGRDHDFPTRGTAMNTFVVLSGPSCIGKGPLHAALRKFHPELASRLTQLILFNDRAPRPGERDGVDYHFRPRGEIEALQGRDDFIVADVRGDLQALDISAIPRIQASGGIPFFEGNPFVPGKLREAGLFDRFPALTIFLAPLSREELLYLKDQGADLPALVTDVQRRKLLNRTVKQKINLSLRDLENIEKRAASALVEMREAWKFDHVIPLHDGEGNDNWDAHYYPIGDARRALLAFVALLQGESPGSLVERWEEGLVP